jgi:hypothetical protein
MTRLRRGVGMTPTGAGHSNNRRVVFPLAGLLAAAAAIVLTYSFATGPLKPADAEPGGSGDTHRQVPHANPNGQPTINSAAAATTNPLASLPRIPWEGGSAYYAKYPRAKAAGWSSPNFFPIGIIWDSFSSDAEVKFDKSYGITTYFEGNPDANADYLVANGMTSTKRYNYGTTANRMSAWVMDYLADEIDGRYDPPAAGQAALQDIINEYGNDGRIKFNNFTAIVSSYYNDAQIAADNTYVNMVDGPVSVDGYWYTDTHCSTVPYTDYSFYPINQAHCRTASSYGKMVKSVRARVASDHIYQPVYVNVELMGGGTESTASGRNIKPGEIQGAVMDGIINEARGVIYFNQSFHGPCTGGNLIRTVEVNPNGCAAANMAGMKRVNSIIKKLAPVLNTQSYQHNFGSSVDTMLKWYDGAAYLFAMPSGFQTSKPGSRTFTLPTGLAHATSVQVLNENRSIKVTGGKFTDNFAAEYTYHIYKITPGLQRTVRK